MLREGVEFVKLRILEKLMHFGKIGGSHTVIYHLKTGLPSHLTDNKKGQKIIKQAIKELIQDQWLLTKPSTGEIHCSINPGKIKEIKEFTEQN